ncbi:MAG: LysM peptidoglycan-binding domain-containing protein [Patescibacteria group bacterium]
MFKLNKSGIRSVVAWGYSVWTAGLTLVVGFVLVLFVASLILVKTKNRPDTQTADRSQLGSGVTTVETGRQQTAVTLDSLAYQVVPGDSLWRLAEQFLGDARRYPEIAKFNHLSINARLKVDQQVLIPLNMALDERQPKEVGVTELPSSDRLDSQRGLYLVKKGDCLWQIAEQELGDPYWWGEIYKLNRQLIGDNPDLIFPEQQLALPKAQLN